MSKRYLFDEHNEWVWDDKTKDYLCDRDMYILLNEKDDKIRELKEKHKKQVAKLNDRIKEAKKANDTFGFIVDYIKEYLGKQNICPKDVEDVLTEIKNLKENNKCQI